MANIEDIEGVSGVFGGVKIDEPTESATSTGGVFGGAQFETGNEANVETNAGVNLPVESGVWNKVKSVLFYEFSPKLTPYQQKIENELNDFIFEKLSWSNFKNFLFKNVSFGKNKEE